MLLSGHLQRFATRQDHKIWTTVAGLRDGTTVNQVRYLRDSQKKDFHA